MSYYFLLLGYSCKIDRKPEQNGVATCWGKLRKKGVLAVLINYASLETIHFIICF